MIFLKKPSPPIFLICTVFLSLLILGFGAWAGGASLSFTYDGKQYKYESKPHFQIVVKENGELGIKTQ